MTNLRNWLNKCFIIGISINCLINLVHRLFCFINYRNHLKNV